MSEFLPVLDREIPVVYDASSLEMEIERMREDLGAATDQLALERQLASDIHDARRSAVLSSEPLRLVFGVDDDDEPAGKREPTSAADQIAAAFLRETKGTALPHGFTDKVGRILRKKVHTDLGGDEKLALDIAGDLGRIKHDPAFSIANAMRQARTSKKKDFKSLGLERYQLWIALHAVEPQFGSPEEAQAHAKVEIEGAEWRMRTQAAAKCLNRIIGSSEIWSGFLQSLVDEQQTSLIRMVNQMQPRILSLNERLHKGSPITLDKSAITQIDSTFERIWLRLGPANQVLPYMPPYQNWLSTLLPAMELLDPGRKTGEEYTDFKPPIAFVTAPAPQRSLIDLYSDEESLFARKKDRQSNSIYGDNLIYNNKEYDPYEKY